MIAGVLIIIAAIYGLIWAYINWQWSFDPGFWGSRHYQQQALMALLFSFGSLFGAYFALSGQSRFGAVVGTIIGLFAMPVLSIGFVCGVVALILLALSKQEFEEEQERRRVFADQPPPQY